MKTIAGVLLAAALAFGAGCMQADWIDRTLVTEDGTGSWYGTCDAAGTKPELWLELRQQGPNVTGTYRTSGLGNYRSQVVAAGQIEGSVAGDVFAFKDPRGTIKGEMTVDGDEMKGQLTAVRASFIILRRSDSAPRPSSR
jgi:hypothetical protein